MKNVMSAERARELLDGFPAKAALSFEEVRDGAHVAVNGSFFYDHDDGDEDPTGNPIVITTGEAALYEHAPEFAEAVVALHAELSAVRAALREALPDPSGQYSADGAELVSLVKLLDARHKAALGHELHAIEEITRVDAYAKELRLAEIDWRPFPSADQVLTHNHRTGGDCYGPWLRLRHPDDEYEVAEVEMLAVDGNDRSVVILDKDDADTAGLWRPITRRMEALPWP